MAKGLKEISVYQNKPKPKPKKTKERRPQDVCQQPNHSTNIAYKQSPTENYPGTNGELCEQRTPGCTGRFQKEERYKGPNSEREMIDGKSKII